MANSACTQETRALTQKQIATEAADASSDVQDRPSKKLILSASLRNKIRERRKVSSLFDPEQIKRRDNEMELKNLTSFFDLVFFHMRDKRTNGINMKDLAEQLAKTSRKEISSKTAMSSLKWLVQLLPEVYEVSEVKDEGSESRLLFSLKNYKALKENRSEVREKLASRIVNKLSDLESPQPSI